MWKQTILALIAAAAWSAPALAAEGSGGSPVPVIAGLLALIGVCGALIATRRGLGLLASTVSGAGISLYLGWEHYAVQAGGAPSVCSTDATFNCDIVNTSKWAEMGGIPIAFFGFGFFVGMTWLASRVHFDKSKNAAAFLALGAGLALFYDAYLAYAQFQLKTICLFCSATYLLNVLLLIGGLLHQRAEGVSVGQGLSKGVGEAFTGGLLGIVGLVVTMIAIRPPQTDGATMAKQLESDPSRCYAQTNGPIELHGSEPVLGDPNAPYTVVEWADFECPHCALAFPEMKEYLSKHKDVKLLFKNYPISGTCNPNVDGERHVNACHAAAAAVCANQQGRFWVLAEKMFGNQQYLAMEDINFMVKQIGMDQAAFDACMKDPATMQIVTADVNGGARAGITGTPAMFLKGAFEDQWVSLNGHSDAVDCVLQAKASGKPLPKPLPQPPM